MESLVNVFLGQRLPPRIPSTSAVKDAKVPPQQARLTAYTRLVRIFEDRFLLLTPSPQERAALRARTLDNDPIWRVRQNEYKNRPPPLGYIRVAFYDDITKLYRDIEPDIESFVKLPLSGVLDLRKLRHEWGLETCVPIHPMKWKVEHPSDPDTLSPLAVYNNTDHRVRCIKFTEPVVSRLTLYQRRLRASILVLFEPTIQFPVPQWYQDVQNMSDGRWQELLESINMFLFLFIVAWNWYQGWFTFNGLFVGVRLGLRHIARHVHIRFE